MQSGLRSTRAACFNCMVGLMPPLPFRAGTKKCPASKMKMKGRRDFRFGRNLRIEHFFRLAYWQLCGTFASVRCEPLSMEI